LLHCCGTHSTAARTIRERPARSLAGSPCEGRKPRANDPFMAPRALILDFGEVLTRPQPGEAVERLAALAGLPLDEFVARYWRHRPDYDNGLQVDEYWKRVLERPGPVPATTIRDLIAADALSWTDYRTEVWDLAARFHASGHRTAMLSNGVSEIIGRVRAERCLEDWFDTVIVSCEVGCCKPDPAIYQLCLDRLGEAAAQTLFVDDRAKNLQAAEAVGLGTLQFTGDESVPLLRKLLDL
jgi:putative hydrolase of the HAD superfamily